MRVQYSWYLVCVRVLVSLGRRVSVFGQSLCVPVRVAYDKLSSNKRKREIRLLLLLLGFAGFPRPPLTEPSTRA